MKELATMSLEEKIEYAESIRYSNPKNCLHVATEVYTHDYNDLSIKQQLTLMTLMGSCNWRISDYEAAMTYAADVMDLSISENEQLYEL